MQTFYKVYGMILGERLGKEVEKGIGFRKIRQGSERGWGQWIMYTF